MQNKPNLQKSQMFITAVKTTNYSEKLKMDTWSKRTQTNPTCSELVEPILSAFGGNVSAESVLSFRFLAITIYCVLPRLPKYTPVVGFGVKNNFLQKMVFDIGKPHLASKLM